MFKCATARHEKKASRPVLEDLEARLVLSTLGGRPVPAAAVTRALEETTVVMGEKANGMIGEIATGRALVVGGHTMAGATVRVEVGGETYVTKAGPRGHYRLRMRAAMPPGSYEVRVLATDGSGGRSSASMTLERGDMVVAWVQEMMSVIQADRANVGKATRTMAMVSAAVYDAVNAIERKVEVFKIDVSAPRYASTSAAAAEAAYTVLAELDPAMKPRLDAMLSRSLATVPETRARAAGVAVGREVARGILDWRADDGSSAIVPYQPGSAPGQWRPTPPNYAVAWGPEWGIVEPFAMTAAATYLPPPPPALDSPEYAMDLQQTHDLGAADSATRTADQTQAGIFWAYDRPGLGSPAIRFEQIAVDVALQRHNTLAENARMFGLVNIAMADAGLVAWNAKYTYNVWRPITAIHLADTDGNPATVADPTWEPLGSPGDPGQPNFTPPFPEYVSGHATFGAATFAVLADFYGTDKVHFTAGSDELPGVVRSFDRFSAASMENALSRIYLGVHVWPDEAAGLKAGSDEARDLFANFMRPVRGRPN